MKNGKPKDPRFVSRHGQSYKKNLAVGSFHVKKYFSGFHPKKFRRNRKKLLPEFRWSVLRQKMTGVTKVGSGNRNRLSRKAGKMPKSETSSAKLWKTWARAGKNLRSYLNFQNEPLPGSMYSTLIKIWQVSRKVYRTDLCWRAQKENIGKSDHVSPTLNLKSGELFGL